LLVAATATIPVNLTSGSAAGSCQEINGHQYCVVDVWTEQDTVAPGASVTVHAVVENRGSKTETIVSYLGVRRPSGDKHYPERKKTYDIAVGEQVEIEYTAEIANDAQEGEYDVTVDVWTGNDAEMFDTSGWLQEFSVEEPTTEAVVTGTRAVSGTYAPGDTVPVDVSVENTGDTTHEFYVDASLQRPNGDWVTGEGTTVALQPGDERQLTLGVTVPDDAVDGTYSAGSGVFHTGAKDQQYDYGQDLDAITVEEPTTGATITGTSAESGTYAPGDTVSVDVAVENTGDTTHEFYVDASLQRPNGDWVTGEGTTVALQPGDERQLSLGVTVPDDAVDGTYSAGSGVFHTSAKDERYDYGQDLDAVEVDEPTTDARVLDFETETGPFEPGAAVTVDVVVENTGDTTREFYVDASLQTPGGDWFTGESKTPRLSPGERDRLSLDVQLPDDADEGAYGVGSAIYASATKADRYDQEGTADAVAVEEPTTTARVSHVDAPDGTFVPGETVPVDVVVENTGDTTHEFYVDTSLQRPNGDWVTVDGTTVTLHPGAERSLSLDVTIPDDAADGTYSAASGVFYSGAKDERYDTGQDRDAFSVEAPTTDAAVVSTGAEPGTYAPGDTVPVDVVVENTGDTTHEFYVDASLQRPNGDWVTGDGTTVTLQPGDERQFSLDATVPDDAAAGTYSAGSGVFNSSAKDEPYDTGQDLDAFSVEGLTTGDTVSVEGGWKPLQPKEGDTLAFTGEARNTGPVPLEDAHLQVFVDDEQVATKDLDRIDAGETESADWFGEHTVSGDESTVAFVVSGSDGTGEMGEVARHERTIAPAGSPLEVTLPGQVDTYQSYSEPLSHAVELTNPSDTARTVTLQPVVTTVDGTDQETGARREVTVEPGETRSVTVEWPTDDVSEAGAARLSLQQRDGDTVVATDRASVVWLVPATTAPEVVVENGLTGEAVDSADLSITVLGMSENVKPSIGPSSEIAATQVDSGLFRLDALPDGTLVQVEASRPGYQSSKSSFFVGGGAGASSVELTPKTQTIVQVETWSGETVDDLSVTIEGESYETNANGAIRLGERPIGAELDYAIQGSNEKPYFDQGTFTVTTEGVPHIRVEKLEEPSSSPESDTVVFGRELYEDGTVPGDTRAERVETALSDLTDRGYTSDRLKLLFVREDDGVLAVAVNPALWDQYRDDRAYEILPYADSTAERATIASIKFADDTERVFRRGMREAWAGYLEGSERAVSPDDEITSFVGKSQDVYIDRQSPAYVTARGISVFAGSGVGEAREGWRESDAGQFAVEGGFLLADFTPVTAAASKTGKVGKLAKGAKGKVYGTIGKALARGGTSGKLVKRASPQKLSPAIKRIDDASGQDEAYDAVRRYYDDKGDSASQLVRSGVLTERQVVDAARKGMDLREVQKLKRTHRLSDDAVRRLVRYDIRPSDTRAVIDDGLLAADDVETLTEAIEQSNRLQKSNWQGVMADANTMKRNEAFRKFLKDGWDDRDELTFMEMVKRDDIGTARVEGAIGEIRTAAWYGPENVRDMSRTVDDGEIDIVLRGNRYVEVKNQKRIKMNDDLEAQIETYRQYADGGDVELHLYDTRRMYDENVLDIKETLGSKPNVEVKHRPGGRNTVRQDVLDRDSISRKSVAPVQRGRPAISRAATVPGAG
jgi:uncharacterized membrane protein